MMDEIAGLKAKLAQQERNANDVAKSYDKKLAQAYESIGIKESTQRIIKEWQLFAGEKATENAQIAEQLEFTVRVAQDWQSRAVAAERRVAELEAADTWRHPIADNPAKELQDTAMCELIVIGEWDTEDDTWSVEDLVWFSRYSPSVTHWRPLPLWRRGE